MSALFVLISEDFLSALGLLLGSGAVIWAVRMTFYMLDMKVKVDLMWGYMNNHLGAGLKAPKFPFVKVED